LRQDGKTQSAGPQMRFIPVYTELDQLSNSVVDLIAQNKLDQAEAVSHRLLKDYPDQIDGLDRLAQVYEARDEKEKAIEYYRKAADFARSMPGFDQESIDWYLSEANRIRSEK
jgi:tetratricopeptide (TPR) repeat protein